MPKRDSAPIGAPCWVDLFTSDPDQSRRFYGELFGWTVEEAGEEYGGYINFLQGRRAASPAACSNDGQSGDARRLVGLPGHRRRAGDRRRRGRATAAR